MSTQKSISVSDKALLGAAAVLVFVWPVANVIALRNVLLVLLFLWLTYAFVRSGEVRTNIRIGALAPVTLGSLVAWLLIVSLAVDTDPSRSLDEFKGEWLPALAAFWIGIVLVAKICIDGLSTQSVLRPLFFSLVGLAALQFAIAAWYWVTAGTLPGWFGGISDHKWTITHVNALTASLLIAEVITADRRHKPLGLSPVTITGSFALVLTTTYISGTRNGILMLLILMLTGALIWLNRFAARRRKVYWVALVVVPVLMVVAIWGMLQVDPRWKRLAATVPIGWDIDATDAWLNAYEKGLPIAPDGLPVDQSTYERIAWARVGGRLALEHPLGVGIKRNAFRGLLEAEYGDVVPAHSHNGYIDLTLSIGFPGLVLWIFFVGSLIGRGAVSGLGKGLGTGTALMLLVGAFAIRAGIDSTIRDHMLEEFMFFAGVLLAASGKELFALSLNTKKTPETLHTAGRAGP